MSDDLRQRDIKYLWHPYTEITAFEQMAFPIIERAEGAYLYDTNGRALLDGIASWWCVNLGHSHPRLVQAMQDQAGILQHSILGGMSHPKAIELGERLVEFTPEGLDHVYFACDGASAVEAALKIAVQYRVNTGEPERTRFISLYEGYHGDTLGAMGVGFVDTFHKDFRDVVIPAHRACSPHCAACPYGKEPKTCGVACFESMESLIREHHREATAVIVEPLCQGSAGMRIYPVEYLQKLRALCDEYDLLLIADEIAVGFGRTGAMFACEKAGIVPDIMTVGKGMTGGYMPMSAALATSRIYDSFRADGGQTRTFYDGHTFCGNPVTSAVALAALSVYEEEDILNRIAPRITQFDTGMRTLTGPCPTSTVLTLGMIGALEISEADGGASRARRMVEYALNHGLFIRPLGSVLYLWPPLTSSESELAEMLAVLNQAAEKTG